MSEEAAVARTYSYVCDDGAARRLERALCGRSRRISTTLLGVGVTLLMVATVADPTWSSLFYLVPVGILVALVVRGRLATARSFRAIAAPGVEFRSSFGDEAFEVAGPNSSSTLRYTAIAEIAVRDGVTVWKQRDARIRVGVPVEIFPLDEVARVKAAAGIV